MSRQPERQVDVEVVRSFLCVATSQISQRAAAPVRCENPAFDKYQARKDSRTEKVTPGTGEGNCHDTSSEDKPNRRVQKLYRCQDGNSFRLKFHEKFSLDEFDWQRPALGQKQIISAEQNGASRRRRLNELQPWF